MQIQWTNCKWKDFFFIFQSFYCFLENKEGSPSREQQADQALCYSQKQELQQSILLEQIPEIARVQKKCGLSCA